MALSCTADVFDENADGHLAKPCGKPATVLLTITGADRSKSDRAGSARSTPWNMRNEPRCDACERIDRGIAACLYPGSAVQATPIEPRR